jgi:hypothetical protein
MRATQLTFFTCCNDRDSSIIDGSFSFGQYSQIINKNLPFGAGSQLDSLSGPGDSVDIQIE